MKEHTLKTKKYLPLLLLLFAVCILLPQREHCYAADCTNVDAVVYAWKEKADVYYYEPRYVLYGGTDPISIGSAEGDFSSISFGTEKYYFDISCGLYDANGTKLYELFEVIINPLYDDITNPNYASERASMSDYELKRAHYRQWRRYVQAKQGWIAGLQHYSGTGDLMCNHIGTNPEIDGTNLYHVQTYSDIWANYMDKPTITAIGYSLADALVDRTNRAGYLISYLNQDGVFYAFKTGVINDNTNLDEKGYMISDIDCSYTDYITFTVEDLYNDVNAKLPKELSCVAKYTKAYGSQPFQLEISDAAGSVSYQSSNPKVAKVSSSGKVTIVNTGYADITITADNGTAESRIYVVPKKPTISSAKAAAPKTITLKWKRDKRASGYQVKYSANSSFKNAVTKTLNSNKTVSYKAKNLKSKKYYYVKMRAYKTINGKKYYGAWSQVKKIKIK